MSEFDDINKQEIELTTNIVKPSERMSFGVVGNEFINIYSPKNKLKVSGDFVFFLFTNVKDIHRPLIGYGQIKYDKFSFDMLKIYGIELISVYETTDTMNRFFNNQKFEMLSTSNFNKKIYLTMKNEFLNKDVNDILSDKVLNINSFFVRDNIAEVADLRQKYSKIIFKDIERQYVEISNLINDGEILNPHKFNP